MNEVLSFAEKPASIIRNLRDSTEQNRHIATPIVQTLLRKNLCRMLLDIGAAPKYTPEQWLSVLETLAGAEASMAWIAWGNTQPCFWALLGCRWARSHFRLHQAHVLQLHPIQGLFAIALGKHQPLPGRQRYHQSETALDDLEAYLCLIMATRLAKYPECRRLQRPPFPDPAALSSHQWPSNSL